MIYLELVHLFTIQYNYALQQQIELTVLTIWHVTKLSTNHLSIILSPEVITNCTPATNTDLYSSFIWWRTINKSYFTMVTLSWGCEWYSILIILLHVLAKIYILYTERSIPSFSVRTRAIISITQYKSAAMSKLNKCYRSMAFTEWTQCARYYYSD